MNKYSNNDAVECYPNASMQMGESKSVEIPTVLGEFSKRLEKDIAGLHSLADRIEQRLHKICNTNYPQHTEDISDKPLPRGNSDLEFELFQGIESLERLNDKLYNSLSKLERII